MSAIASESRVVDSIAVYLYPVAHRLPVCVQGDGNCQSGKSASHRLYLFTNTYISYTRHYYSLQYARNRQVLRQIGPKRFVAKAKSQTSDNRLTEVLIAHKRVSTILDSARLLQ